MGPACGGKARGMTEPRAKAIGQVSACKAAGDGRGGKGCQHQWQVVGEQRAGNCVRQRRQVGVHAESASKGQPGDQQRVGDRRRAQPGEALRDAGRRRGRLGWPRTTHADLESALRAGPGGVAASDSTAEPRGARRTLITASNSCCFQHPVTCRTPLSGAATRAASTPRVPRPLARPAALLPPACRSRSRSPCRSLHPW